LGASGFAAAYFVLTASNFYNKQQIISKQETKKATKCCNFFCNFN